MLFQFKNIYVNVMLALHNMNYNFNKEKNIQIVSVVVCLSQVAKVIELCAIKE